MKKIMKKIPSLAFHEVAPVTKPSVRTESRLLLYTVGVYIVRRNIAFNDGRTVHEAI